MCRLFAMIGAPPLPLQGAIEPFAALSEKGAVLSGDQPGHRDGWAFSGFSKERAVYFDRQTQPLRSAPDRIAAVTQRAASTATPIVIGHLGKGAAAPAEMGNVQPFHYRDWVFAHNGNIFDAQGLDIADYHTQGGTASERFLVWLVDQVGVAINPTDTLAGILTEVREKIHFDSLTFLLSDGIRLWAYREISNEKLEPGVTVADRRNYFALHTAKVGDAALLCSEPLPGVGTGWKAFPERTLATFSIGSPDPVLRPV